MIFPIPYIAKKEPKSRYEVFIGRRSYNEIFHDIKKDKNETFGLFLGTKKEGEFYITHVIDEGVHAGRNPAQISIDHEYVNYRIRRTAEIYPDIEILGLYHKHPSGFRQFSHLDYKAMKDMYNNWKEPFFSFLAFDKEDGIEFLTFLYNGKDALPIDVELKVISDEDVFSKSGLSDIYIHYNDDKEIESVYLTKHNLENLEKGETVYFSNIGNSSNVIVLEKDFAENYMKKIGEDEFRLKIGFKYYLINRLKIKEFENSGIKKRAEGLISLDSMKEKRVLIIGAGSVGGHIALQLSRIGVGEIDIIDYDKVELYNPFRHELGLESVGLLKAEALKDRILRINPDIKVNVFNKPFERNEFSFGLDKDYDLVISTADSRLVHKNANEFAKAQNTKFIAIGLTSKGEKGEIFVYLPEITGDYETLLKLSNINEEDLRKEKSKLVKRMYVDAKDLDEENVIPTIYPHIVRIVSIGIDFCIKLLENNTKVIEKGNFWIINNNFSKENFLTIEKYEIVCTEGV